MKKLLLAAVAASAAIAPVTAQAQRAPAAVVVVVDTSRVYRDCNACRTATTSLQSQITNLQTRQKTLTDQLRPEGQAIQTAINALNGKEPDAALRTRVQTYQQREQSANQELSRTQQNIQSIQANVLRQINERLAPIFTQVMNARGANLAIDSDSTLARGQALDVTNDVLAALNQQLPSVSLTPLPQQQQPAATQGR